MNNFFPTHNSSGFANSEYSAYNEFGFPEHQYFPPPYQDYNANFWCDACEKNFQNKFILQKHINEHHSSRLKSTNTPEEIAKWISDRKRKYPSTENVIKRQRINEEKRKRGEVLTSKCFPKKNRPSHSNNVKKGGSRKFSRFKNNKSKYNKQKSVDFNALEKINKESWKGDLPPFPGTKILFQDKSSSEEEEESESDHLENECEGKFSDEEWKEQPITTASSIKINNALGLLMNNYSSSEDENEDISKNNIVISSKTNVPSLKKENLNTASLNADDDDEPPDEQPIVHVNDNNTISNSIRDSNKANISEENKTNQVNNKKKVEGGNSRNRKRQNKIGAQSSKKADTNKPTRYYKKETLLEMLLRNEIRHERNILLQCVKYVVDNQFFGLNNNKTQYEL